MCLIIFCFSQVPVLFFCKGKISIPHFCFCWGTQREKVEQLEDRIGFISSSGESCWREGRTQLFVDAERAGKNCLFLRVFFKYFSLYALSSANHKQWRQSLTRFLLVLRTAWSMNLILPRFSWAFFSFFQPFKKYAEPLAFFPVNYFLLNRKYMFLINEGNEIWTSSIMIL